MKKACLMAIAILWTFVTCAQVVKVEGRLTDTNGQPMQWVVVKHVDAESNKMLNYCQTDAEGRFSIEAKVGNSLQVSSLGYKARRIEVKEGMPFQKLTMTDDAVTLKEVNVKSEKVKLSGDTIKYLLATYAQAGDRTLADVLRRVPGFEVNKESGQISYGGKPISNFYIEGLDLLGAKYGVATNTLPQGEVASVEVIKHHQPVRVLKEFTYTNDDAVNIRMKDGAKAHWIVTAKGTVGLKSKGTLWEAESFAMRIKPQWQLMATYKSNNLGKPIGKETTNLFNFDEISSRLTDVIQLPVANSGFLGRRSLFNRSHSFTLNTLKRINDISQVNLQLIYENNEENTWERRVTEYYRAGDTRLTDNQKHGLTRENNLHALLKYENNANNHYLKNKLQGDLEWRKQWLNETGTNAHIVYAKLPKFTVRDDLYLIKRWGKHLLSFNSGSIYETRPQRIQADSALQTLTQHYFETNTSLQGALLIGKVKLSTSLGVNAVVHNLQSNLYGVPDSVWANKIGDGCFGFCQLYVNPETEYRLRDVRFTLSAFLEHNMYWYRGHGGQSHAYVSPGLTIQWNATPRLEFRCSASEYTSQVDINRFFDVLILQDYEYASRGYNGYAVCRERNVRLRMLYKNALQATHFNVNVTRTQGTNPYTTSREFVGKYIVLSLLPFETRYNMWKVTSMLSKGFSLFNTKLQTMVDYNHTNTYISQDGMRMPLQTDGLGLKTSLGMVLWKGMDFNYALSYRWSKMYMPDWDKRSSLNNWHHEAQAIIPLVGAMKLETNLEWYRNQLPDRGYKDMVFVDLAFGYVGRHIDCKLKLTNALNKSSYAYSMNNDLVRTTTDMRVRGRELVLTLTYRP